MRAKVVYGVGLLVLLTILASLAALCIKVGAGFLPFLIIALAVFMVGTMYCACNHKRYL